MTRYQPIHKSGRKGPICERATEAALWIIGQIDMMEWHWEAVA